MAPESSPAQYISESSRYCPSRASGSMHTHTHRHMMRICSASTHYLGAPLTPSESLITQIFFFSRVFASVIRSRAHWACTYATEVRDGSAFLVVHLWLKNGRMGTPSLSFYMMGEWVNIFARTIIKPAALRCSQVPRLLQVSCCSVSALFRRLVLLLSWILCFGDDAWIENTLDKYAKTLADCSILPEL